MLSNLAAFYTSVVNAKQSCKVGLFFFSLWEKHTYLTSATICCVSHLEIKMMANKECHCSERGEKWSQRTSGWRQESPASVAEVSVGYFSLLPFSFHGIQPWEVRPETITSSPPQRLFILYRGFKAWRHQCGVVLGVCYPCSPPSHCLGRYW